MAVAQHGQQFPAGVNPALCPNYPNCDNAYLHTGQQQQQQPQHFQQTRSWSHETGAPAVQWNQPAPVAPAPAWNQPAAHWQQPAQPAFRSLPAQQHQGVGGDKYPAGVDPQACPNYPYCDNVLGGGAAPRAAPLPGFTERLYPAGVSASECPNFPYCN